MQDKQPLHPLSPIKHSMKRRCHGHDYSGKGLYMVTLVVRGRRRLLGTLEGGIGNPHVHLSALGESVEQCVLSISKVHPEVEVWKHVVMEDHVHVLLYVSRSMAGKDLGVVVKGFKTGCSKAFRSLCPGQEALLPLFEEGYHDRILRREGQLEAMKHYITRNQCLSLNSMASAICSITTQETRVVS